MARNKERQGKKKEDDGKQGMDEILGTKLCRPIYPALTDYSIRTSLFS
ncbi:hypothetical protein [Peribacillus frigoritolerans]